MSSVDTILGLDLPLHSPSLPRESTPKNPNPPKHTSKHFFTLKAQTPKTARIRELPLGRRPADPLARGPGQRGEPARRPPPTARTPRPGALASSRATKPSLRRRLARADSHGGRRDGQGLVLAPASPDRAPRAPAPEAAGVPALAGAGPAGSRAAAGTRAPPARARPRRRPSSARTDLSSPPRLGRGPSSSGRLSGRRRPRPPPPPATASFPCRCRHRRRSCGTRASFPGGETGKGAQRPQETPRPSPAAAPALSVRTGVGPPAGLGGAEEAPPPAGSAPVGRSEAQVGAADGERPSRRRATQGGVRERAEGTVSTLPRRRVGLYRLLQSPRAERHHLGKNADLAAAASREDWLGGPSIPAGSAHRLARRGSLPGRRGAGRGRERAREGTALCSAVVGSAPSCLPSSQRKGGWEREVALWLLLAVLPGSVAIFAARRGRRGPLLSPCGLFPDRKQAVHWDILGPLECWRSTVGYLARRH